MARSVGVYGGSFNPPHVGHLLLVEYLLALGIVDEILVVPVYQHALSKQVSNFEFRLELCRLAFAFEKRVRVSAIESTLPTPNYSFETIRALREQEDDTEFRLIFGSDVLQESHRWHRFDELTQLAPPVVVSRAGYPVPASLPFEVLPALLPEVSSSEVRECLRLGRFAELSHLVPAQVLAALKSSQL